MGLVGSSDHEITAGQSISLDFTNLLSLNLSSLTIMFGSVTGSDSATVCAGTSSFCITVNSSDDDKALSILSLFADMKNHGLTALTITGVSGDVLIDQLQANTVPEPSSLLLVGAVCS